MRSAPGLSRARLASASGIGGSTLAHTVTANIDWPRAERKKRLPAAQVSAESSARPTASTLAVPSTERPISTTPSAATASPSHWPRVACSRRKTAASTTVSGPCSCTRTDVRPGGRPACMAKNRKTNWPANMNPPMPASVAQGMLGRGTNSTGRAPSTKRQVAKVKGVNSFSPKRITGKLRPQIATMRSAPAVWSGLTRLQPDRHSQTKDGRPGSGRLRRGRW